MANNFFKFKRFTIFQDKCAMKVGTDGVLIGAWTNFDQAHSILDVGCGTGLISIMAAQLNSSAIITGIDIDDSAVEQALQNSSNTEWSERINIKKQDFSLLNGSHYDVIVSNPPYFKEDIKSPDKSRSTARSCDTLNYCSLIEHSSHLLSPKGRLSFISPCQYYDEIIEHALSCKLYPLRVAKVYPLPCSEPKRIMIELSFFQEDVIYQDIIIEESRHNYSDEYISLTKDFYLKF